jgi:hypothetical protein
MKKTLFLLMISLSIGCDFKNPTQQTQQTQSTEKVKVDSTIKTIALIYNDSVENRIVNMDYVRRFYAVAKSEQGKFGIPVSIILSSAIYNSEFGESRLTVINNNHFKLISDLDVINGGFIYKKYDNAFLSYRDFSLHFIDIYKGYYEKLDKDDYRGWIDMIGKHYNRQYSENLRKIVVGFELYRLD